MSISIRIEPGTGLAVATGGGPIAADEARDALVRVWASDGWSGAAVVWDLRAASFELTSEEIRGLAAFVLQSQPDPPPARVVFVTSRDLEFGLARMFGAYRHDRRTQFQVVRDLEEGLEWARALAVDRGD